MKYKEKQALAEEIIIIINNLICCLSQNLNNTTEMEELLILGYQQEFIMTVKMQTCFLLKIVKAFHQH